MENPFTTRCSTARILNVVWLGLFVLGLTTSVSSAQVLSFSVERQKWLTQTITNAVPFLYKFEATLIGIGLSEASVHSPTSTNNFSGTARQMLCTSNFPAVSVVNSNIVFGLDQLNASFPVGSYALHVVTMRTNPINQNIIFTTNNYTAPLTNDFPTVNPMMTNLVPGTHLQATQTFRWPAFSTAAVDSTVCQVFEGQFDTNTLIEIANGNGEVLTNFTWLNPFNYKFANGNNSLTLSNINILLDHLVLLQFRAPSPNSLPAFPTNNFASVATSLILYLAQPPPVTLSVAPANGEVALLWPTNAGNTYRLQSSVNLSNWFPMATDVTTNAQGNFVVVQPTSEGQRFYRLRSE